MNSNKNLYRILILLFIFWVLYHFFDFKFSKLFSLFSNKGAKKDSPKKTENLDNYLKTLTASDRKLKDITLDNQTKITPKKYSDIILENIQKMLSISDKYQVKNIKLLDKIKEQKTNLGFYYLPFRIEGDYYYNKKKVNKVKIQLELQVILDREEDIFIGPVSVYDQSGVLKISRIHLLDNNDSKFNESLKKLLFNKEEKIEKPEKKELPKKHNLLEDSEKKESVEKKDKPIEVNSNINFNIDYDVSKEFQDSLIPDKINFTEYQSTSNNETSKIQNKPQYL